MPTISHQNSAANKRFLIGFEFECRVSENFYDDFCIDLRHFGIENIGHDGSIRSKYGFTPVEFRTKPLPYDMGIARLEELLSYIYIYTEAGLFETDQSCGFHVNVSSPDIMKKRSPERLKYFFCKFAQVFKEHDVLKMYRRCRNDYCHPYMGKYDRSFKRTVRRFFELSEGTRHSVTDKYRAVALRSMDNGRIEIRCLGNKNYHTRFDEAKKVLEHIKGCLDLAYSFVNDIPRLKPLHTIVGEKTEVNAINNNANHYY